VELEAIREQAAALEWVEGGTGVTLYHKDTGLKIKTTSPGGRLWGCRESLFYSHLLELGRCGEEKDYDNGGKFNIGLKTFSSEATGLETTAQVFARAQEMFKSLRVLEDVCHTSPHEAVLIEKTRGCAPIGTFCEVYCFEVRIDRQWFISLPSLSFYLGCARKSGGHEKSVYPSMLKTYEKLNTIFRQQIEGRGPAALFTADINIYWDRSANDLKQGLRTHTLGDRWFARILNNSEWSTEQKKEKLEEFYPQLNLV